MNNKTNASAGKNAQEELLTLLPEDDRSEYIATLGDAVCHIIIGTDGKAMDDVKGMLLGLAYMRSHLQQAKTMIEKGLPHAR